MGWEIVIDLLGLSRYMARPTKLVGSIWDVKEYTLDSEAETKSIRLEPLVPASKQSSTCLTNITFYHHDEE